MPLGELADEPGPLLARDPKEDAERVLRDERLLLRVEWLDSLRDGDADGRDELGAQALGQLADVLLVELVGEARDRPAVARGLELLEGHLLPADSRAP